MTESGVPPPPLSESGVDPDPSTTLTTSATTDTGSTTDVVDTSSEGDSAEGCGCPPNVPIEFDDMLERGFTPAEAIAEFDDATLAFEWIGYPEQPPTTLHLDVEYTGGAVAQGPGGSDGCMFLSGPCHDGVVMEVTLSLSTADGWLIWTTPAELTGVVGERGYYVELSLAAYADVGASTGSLAEQPLVVEGMPVTIEALRFDAVRFELDGRFATGVWLMGSLADDVGFHELGSTPEPP
ncbi:MAG: hypothetical protein IAG13_31370 [Deltaproteobacteria bacterium]|nr:hypothetical protein [Nannocystaceae bacterium]